MKIKAKSKKRTLKPADPAFVIGFSWEELALAVDMGDVYNTKVLIESDKVNPHSLLSIVKWAVERAERKESAKKFEQPLIISASTAAYPSQIVSVPDYNSTRGFHGLKAQEFVLARSAFPAQGDLVIPAGVHVSFRVTVDQVFPKTVISSSGGFTTGSVGGLAAYWTR